MVKFRRYEGHIKSLLIANISLVIVISILTVILKRSSDDCRFILFFWLLPCVSITLLTVCSLYGDIYKINKGHLSDMIVLDDKGVNLQCVNGANALILWTDISSIVKVPGYRTCSTTLMTGKNGEKIWWYTNKAANKYIQENHPEL